jgi:hypothetical protein
MLLGLLLASAVRADIAPEFPYNWFPHSRTRPRDFRYEQPLPVVPNKVPITIALGQTTTQARLLIPRKLLKEWQVASLDMQPQPLACGSLNKPFLALTGLLAVGCCGLWFISGRRRWGKPAAALAVLLTLLFGLGTVSVWARAQPPVRPPLPPMKYTDRVTIEVVEEGNEVRLILPAEHFRKNLHEEKSARP